MALAALLRTGIGVGKRLLGRKKKTKWQAEGEDPAAFTKRGTRRKPTWRGESGAEHAAPKRRKATKMKRKKKITAESEQADPSTWSTTKKARARRSMRGRAAAAVTGAVVGGVAGVSLDKKKSITGAGMDVPKTKGMSSYKVKKGDTLSEIAHKTGTTIKQLKTANPQITNINKIKVGQTIKIPRKKRDRKSVYQGLTKTEMGTKTKTKGKVVRLKSGGLIGMGAALRGGGAVRSR